MTVNYVSGSSRTVQSMTLPLRAVPAGARALFIDDFLRGGGTARGVYDLMRECRAEVVGIGVLIEAAQPREKLVDSTSRCWRSMASTKARAPCGSSRAGGRSGSRPKRCTGAVTRCGRRDRTRFSDIRKTSRVSVDTRPARRINCESERTLIVRWQA